MSTAVSLESATGFNNTVPWPVPASGESTLNTSWAGGESNFSTWAGTPRPGDEGAEKAMEGMVMAAIVIGVILVTVLLFSMAIFLDCRNQKLEAESGKSKKTWRPSRRKSRIPVFIANSDANKDAIAFANQMCSENIASNAPARGSDVC